MTELLTRIRSDLKEAMKAKDTLKATTLRGLLAAFTNELVAKGKKPTDTLSEQEMITVIKRAIKQRKDAISQYEAGGRPELAEKEAQELAILEAYLPAMPTEEEIRAAVQSILSENSNMQPGAVIGAVMRHFNGNADGALVKRIVEELTA